MFEQNNMKKKRPLSKCDRCGSKSYIIFINKNHDKFCDNCWDKTKKKSEWEIIQDKNEKREKSMKKPEKGS